MHILQPPDWARPKGYVNGIAARGTLVSIAGQIGWNADGQFETDDLIEQIRQALDNVLMVLAQAGGRPEHIVRMTWYLTDREAYLSGAREIGRSYRERMRAPDGSVHYPAMTAVQVVALIEARAKVEIEATAVIPDPPAGSA
ncbi:MAG: hypothetical protein RL322_958 [Pseudomonadota bacterium]|jgi:enamine deaminase RidA (YjgF/YER057c/UK114 family)